MKDDRSPFQPDSEDVRIIPPDFALKKLIGEDVDIRKVFSPENIARAQAVINSHKDSFLEWVMKDVAALEEAYKNASANTRERQPEVAKLARIAFVIKSQSGTFGFELATRIAKSLDDFCSRHPAPSAEHLLVIRKHIDTLTVIFHKRITGDGGVLGEQLQGSLQKLVAKYS